MAKDKAFIRNIFPVAVVACVAVAYASCVERQPEADSPFVPVESPSAPVLSIRDTVVEEMYPPAEVVEADRQVVRRTDVVALIYTQETGVREATGSNDGSRVEEYLAAAGRRKGDAWCAAFVTWVFRQAGVEAVVSGWSPDWFPAKNTVYVHGKANNTVPQRADVFGIYFQSLGRVAHVGFVDRWEEGVSGFAVTVEGNTNESGSREGDGVYRKRRLKSQVYKVSRWIGE